MRTVREFSKKPAIASLHILPGCKQKSCAQKRTNCLRSTAAPTYLWNKPSQIHHVCSQWHVLRDCWQPDSFSCQKRINALRSYGHIAKMMRSVNTESTINIVPHMLSETESTYSTKILVKKRTSFRFFRFRIQFSRYNTVVFWQLWKWCCRLRVKTVCRIRTESAQPLCIDTHLRFFYDIFQRCSQPPSAASYRIHRIVSFCWIVFSIWHLGNLFANTDLFVHDKVVQLVFISIAFPNLTAKWVSVPSSTRNLAQLNFASTSTNAQ